MHILKLNHDDLENERSLCRIINLEDTEFAQIQESRLLNHTDGPIPSGRKDLTLKMVSIANYDIRSFVTVHYFIYFYPIIQNCPKPLSPLTSSLGRLDAVLCILVFAIIRSDTPPPNMMRFMRHRVFFIFSSLNTYESKPKQYHLSNLKLTRQIRVVEAFITSGVVNIPQEVITESIKAANEEKYKAFFC